MVEGLLKDRDRQLRKVKLYGKQPLPNGYHPELEHSDEMILELSSHYLQLIGIFYWAVELDHIGIFTEVAVMSQYSASPQLGHLEDFYHIFECLRKHEMSKVLFDPSQPNVDQSAFVSGTMNWKDLHGEIKQELPPGMTDTLGNNTHKTCFIDDNHSGNIVTWNSHTGALIYVMNALIVWLSKKQNNFQISTFGSELVAMQIAMYLIVALH